MLAEPEVGQIFDRVWRITDEAWNSLGRYVHRQAYETDDGRVTWGSKKDGALLAPTVEVFKQDWEGRVELVQYSVKPLLPEPTLIDKIVAAADWYLSPDEDEAQYTAFREKLSVLLADEAHTVSGTGADALTYWEDLSTEPPEGINALVEVSIHDDIKADIHPYLVRLLNGKWTWNAAPTVTRQTNTSGHEFADEARASSALRAGQTRLKIVRN